MTLLLAPYNDSMRLGQGFNSYTHELCIDRAVKVNPQNDVKSVESPSQVVSYSSRFVEKLSDVVDTMNVSYSSSIKRGTIEISGNTSTVDETTFKASDLNAVVSVKVTNQTHSIEDGCEFQEIKGIVPGSAQFNQVYGDCYISGFVMGGDFTGIVSIRVLDRAKKDTVVQNIKSALGTTNKEEFTLDSFDTGSQSQASSSMKGTECTISVSWMGGGQVKDEVTQWDLESMYAAAAAFPARVAACPQRTWAILTKYKANHNFVTKFNMHLFKTLEYDQISSYTAELFDSFMDYKLLLKQLQNIINNRSAYQAKPLVPDAIDTSMATLLSVRSALREEQTKIVEAIEVLSRDPRILKRQSSWSETHRAPVVNKIIQQALGKWAFEDKKQRSPALKALPPVTTVTTGAEPMKNQDTATSYLKPDIRAEDGSDDGSFTKVTLAQEQSTENSLSEHSDSSEDEFNFATLIPSEVWEDLMPEPKPDYVSGGFSQGGFSQGGFSQSGFLPNQPGQNDYMPMGFNVANPEVLPDVSILKAKETLEKELEEAKAAVEAAKKETEEAKGQLQAALTEIAQVRQEKNVLNAQSTAALEQERASKESMARDLAVSADQRNQLSQRIASLEACALPRKEGDRVWISAVIWGQKFISDQGVVDKCYRYANSKEAICFNNDFFGTDGWPGVPKTGCVAYRYDDRGLIRYLVMSEGSWGRFDGW